MSGGTLVTTNRSQNASCYCYENEDFHSSSSAQQTKNAPPTGTSHEADLPRFNEKTLGKRKEPRLALPGRGPLLKV
jgi:hypothetical protein